MKKNIILPLLLVVIIGCCFVPFNKDQTVDIDYPFSVVFAQLKPDNWRKWQPQLTAVYAKDPSKIKTYQNYKGFNIDAPGIYINGKTNDGFKFEVSKKINNQESKFSYVAVPQSNAGKCSVILGAKTNVVKWVRDMITHKQTDIDALKKYLNNTKLFYGYEITRGKVIDSNILVQKRIVPIAAKIGTIIKMQQELNAYIKLHNIKQEQPIMADIRNVSKDSALVMIGIPIIGKAKSEGDYKFMYLPPNGNMLSARYKGPYAGRQKLYKAMQSYMLYHSMSSPEVPFEKFLDNKIPLSDTAMVNMQVNFPIF